MIGAATTIIVTYESLSIMQYDTLLLPAWDRYRGDPRIDRVTAFAKGNRKPLFFLSLMYGLIDENTPIPCNLSKMTGVYGQFIKQIAFTLRNMRNVEVCYVSEFLNNTNPYDETMRKACDVNRNDWSEDTSRPLATAPRRIFNLALSTLPKIEEKS